MVKLFSKNSNLCDHNSPTLQTDRQTTCDRNTALCTKVHRAVKIDSNNITLVKISVSSKDVYFFVISTSTRQSLQVNIQLRHTPAVISVNYATTTAPNTPTLITTTYTVYNMMGCECFVPAKSDWQRSSNIAASTIL